MRFSGLAGESQSATCFSEFGPAPIGECGSDEGFRGLRCFLRTRERVNCQAPPKETDNLRGGPSGKNISPCLNKLILLWSRPLVFARSQKRSTISSESPNDSTGSQLSYSASEPLQRGTVDGKLTYHHPKHSLSTSAHKRR